MSKYHLICNTMSKPFNILMGRDNCNIFKMNDMMIVRYDILKNDEHVIMVAKLFWSSESGYDDGIESYFKTIQDICSAHHTQTHTNTHTYSSY